MLTPIDVFIKFVEFCVCISCFEYADRNIYFLTFVFYFGSIDYIDRDILH